MGQFGKRCRKYSCDQVLDSDNDGLFNLEEEEYGTNPNLADSDGDPLDDIHEISNSTITEGKQQVKIVVELTRPDFRTAPFADAAMDMGLLFTEDMDGDGMLNGPSDWDTDGDGMPDGFEFCYSHIQEHPNTGTAIAASQLLDPANNSDGYGDWDEDGTNNIEEYQVVTFGEEKFTSPWHADTDEDQMPDGWEATNGLDPRDGQTGFGLRSRWI